MKKIQLLIFILTCFLTACQHEHSTEKKVLDEEMKSPTLRFDGPAKFAAVHTLIRTRDGEATSGYKVGDVQRAYEKASKDRGTRSGDMYEWKERGPANCGGRTRGLIVDPADTSALTWFAGSVGGGIWKTENGGESWTLLTTDIPNLATSTLAMAPSNGDVIYAGTGEGFGNIDGITGSGMLKSIDRGNTWQVLSATSNDNQFANVTRIIVDPEDENIVIASTIGQFINGVRMSFIMKSIDGGQTWAQKFFTSVGRVQQILHVEGDFDTQYAAVNSRGVYKSEDAGETWSVIWDSRPHRIDRIEMAISRLDAGVAYMACEERDGESLLFFTRDTFHTIFNPIFDGLQPNWLAGQGWYDNTIAVHPYNDSLVWVAGAGPMIQIEPGRNFDTIKVYDQFVNNTTFLKDIDNSPFVDESSGLAADLFQGLPVDPGTTIDDLVNAEVRFGPGVSQKAHLIEVNQVTFDFTFLEMIDVPFEAYDLDNNRQIGLAIFDVNGDGKWSYENYEGSQFPFHDVVTLNMFDYVDTGNVELQTVNAVHKAQYYFFQQRDTAFQGDENNFPPANFLYETAEDQGLLSEFQPVTDGYFQYPNSVGSKGVHVDHHNIIFIPRNDTTESFYVINANDGGVAFSSDEGDSFIQTGTTFNDGSFTSSFGYNVSQFYGIDKMNGADRYVGGTQDNGTWVSGLDPDETSNWVEAPSGDGFEAAWNYDDPSQILETSQFNGLYKSYDGGDNWNFVGLPGGQGPFITRVAASQISADLVFMVSEEGVLKSTDFGDSWEVISMPDGWRFNRSWGPPIEISVASPNIVWTGGGMVDGNMLAVSTDAGDSFHVVNNYDLAVMGTLTGIATNPSDSNTAYALFSQADGPKVLRTRDLGQSWEDISGFVTNAEESSNGFPDVATYTLIAMPWDTAWLWAGTEIGIVESKDGGETWNLANNGLPPVAIWEMKIVGDEIVLATHGRGIWTVDVDQLNPSGIFSPTSYESIDLNVYPNPITSRGTVEFQINKRQLVEVSIFDLQGKLIKTLHRGQLSVGTHVLPFDKSDLNQGLYVVNVQSESAKGSMRILIK